MPKPQIAEPGSRARLIRRMKIGIRAVFAAGAIGLYMAWSLAFAGAWVAPFGSIIEAVGLVSVCACAISGLALVILTGSK